MITAESFRQLKQVSMSVNAEKSKVRILEAFKSTSKQQREEIKELTGFANFNNFYNAGRTGVASPRVVVSLATVLDVSPRYLTGEIDEKLICDAAEIAEIFATYSTGKARKNAKAKPKSKKTGAKATKTPNKRGRPARVKPADDSAVLGSPAATPLASAKPIKTPKSSVAKPATSNAAISDDLLVKLLEALAIRSKYSVDAANTFEQIKALLLK